MTRSVPSLAGSAFALALAAATAAGSAPPSLSAGEVVARLDMTSFPNSIGPRRTPGLKTLADYGFTLREPSPDGSAIALYPVDRRWMYEISVLSSDGDRTVVCVLDRVLDWGSYFSLGPVEVAPGPDGLLHATGRMVADPRCALAKPPG